MLLSADKKRRIKGTRRKQRRVEWGEKERE
jgi:hypothetical protein